MIGEYQNDGQSGCASIRGDAMRKCLQNGAVLLAGKRLLAWYLEYVRDSLSDAKVDAD